MKGAAYGGLSQPSPSNVLNRKESMRGSLYIQDRVTGHNTIPWDTDVDDGPLDPKVAEEEFKKMVSRGAFAFATIEDKPTHTKEFDPETMEKVTIVPAFGGG